MGETNKIKGIVRLAYFEDILGDLIDVSAYDVKLQIVLSIKKGLLRGFTHVPHLAPSEDLYNIAMYKWKKLKFKKEEKEKMARGETGTWWDLYKERFISETKTRVDFRRAYKRLKQCLDNGDNVILVCFCENLQRCHRSIVGHMLEEDGYKVVYG